MLIMKISLRLKFGPFALCAAGVGMLLLAGCEKAAEESPAAAAAALPSNSPAAYMKDPAFRAAVAAKRKEIQAVANELRSLADRMQELVKAHGEDRAKLEKLPEWNDLHKRVEALNAEHAKLRKEQLRLVGERLSPTGEKNVNTISK